MHCYICSWYVFVAIYNQFRNTNFKFWIPVIRTHYIYVSKHVRIRYFSKRKESASKKIWQTLDSHNVAFGENQWGNESARITWEVPRVALADTDGAEGRCRVFPQMLTSSTALQTVWQYAQRFVHTVSLHYPPLSEKQALRFGSRYQLRCISTCWTSQRTRNSGYNKLSECLRLLVSASFVVTFSVSQRKH
jgi:hypothetical protein